MQLPPRTYAKPVRQPSPPSLLHPPSLPFDCANGRGHAVRAVVPKSKRAGEIGRTWVRLVSRGASGMQVPTDLLRPRSLRLTCRMYSTRVRSKATDGCHTSLPARHRCIHSNKRYLKLASRTCIWTHTCRGSQCKLTPSLDRALEAKLPLGRCLQGLSQAHSPPIARLAACRHKHAFTRVPSHQHGLRRPSDPRIYTRKMPMRLD
ncbi:hypothetical protein C8Q80DRAFT_444121 [Daedaleopsis nitida]|nr:hypothetical protein C8Q80DRAFT_444121 [Daedaleopsis nitida]